MRVLFASQVLKNAGRVAQLVEQRIENPRVGSSILPPATNIKRLTLCRAFPFVRMSLQHIHPLSAAPTIHSPTLATADHALGTGFLSILSLKTNKGD